MYVERSKLSTAPLPPLESQFTNESSSVPKRRSNGTKPTCCLSTSFYPSHGHGCYSNLSCAFFLSSLRERMVLGQWRVESGGLVWALYLTLLPSLVFLFSRDFSIPNPDQLKSIFRLLRRVKPLYHYPCCTTSASNIERAQRTLRYSRLAVF